MDELTEIRVLIADLKDILAKPARIDAIIVATSSSKIRDDHGDPRRTRDRGRGGRDHRART